MRGPKFKSPDDWHLPDEVDLDLLTKQIALSEHKFAKFMSAKDRGREGKS
jgi:hypothetical protein